MKDKLTTSMTWGSTTNYNPGTLILESTFNFFGLYHPRFVEHSKSDTLVAHTIVRNIWSSPDFMVGVNENAFLIVPEHLDT